MRTALSSRPSPEDMQCCIFDPGLRVSEWSPALRVVSGWLFVCPVAGRARLSEVCRLSDVYPRPAKHRVLQVTDSNRITQRCKT